MNGVNARTNRNENEGQIITIDGSRSFDPDVGKIVKCDWTMKKNVNSSEISLVPQPLGSCKIKLKVPLVSQDRTYIITLRVTDDEGDTDIDSMKLTVKDTAGSDSDINKRTTKKTTTTTETDISSKYVYLGRLGFPGTGAGQVLEPTDLRIDTEDNMIYVADKDNNRIDVFNTTGKYVTSWGSEGSGKGQFKQPGDLAADFSEGVIFVSEIGNNRIQKFSYEGIGRFLETFLMSATAICHVSSLKLRLMMIVKVCSYGI